MLTRRNIRRNTHPRLPLRASTTPRQHFARIRNWADNLSVFTKWVLVVGAKSTVVSLVLGALAPYATAFYAIKNGFRVPVEGVPYINFAIAIWSFLSFFIAIAMFTLLMTSLQQISLFFRLENRFLKPSKSLVEYRNRVSRSSYFLGAAGISAIAVFIILISDWQYHKTFVVFGKDLSIRGTVIIFLVSIMMVITNFYFISRKYDALKIQMMLSIPLVVLMAISLFLPDTYGSFLRIIRYGGGIHATIISSSDGLKEIEKYSGYIMIQNDNVVLMLSEDRSRVMEIPTSKIFSKTIDVTPRWESPLYSINQQSLLVNLDFIDAIW